MSASAAPFERKTPPSPTKDASDTWFEGRPQPLTEAGTSVERREEGCRAAKGQCRARWRVRVSIRSPKGQHFRASHVQ